MIGDELPEVFVWGDHEALAISGSVGDHGSDEVIGLETIEDEERDAECGEETFDMREGGDEILGHGFAVGFVFGEEDVTFGGGWGIESGDEMSWGVILDQV